MTNGEPSTGSRQELRGQIREFLASRRARLSPEQAGLPVYGGGRRRVAGLRREEVAVLAGVSPQYYIRFERGDATGISPGIVDDIARALQLDAAERAHLLHLLRTAIAPTRAPQRPVSATEQVRPTVQRLLDAMESVPATVLSGRLDVLAANGLGRALFSPVFAGPDPVPNMALFTFLDPQAPALFRDWGTVANDTVAILRAEAGRDPHDRDLSDLVGRLSTRSDDFRVRWAAHDVRIHSDGVKRFRHPVVGDLDLPFETLPLGFDTTSGIVAYTAVPDSASADALSLLASWAASDAGAASATPAPSRPARPDVG
ncbi:helix-turn-helix transcriptional regulator [Solicola sp. PLA-1-18]|uniref:helix-turn-helix transcriptional regulator n=1 Tax=Solicola sp. PLA-1-18 TaxID=3380532 RepID=UPI003B790607